jgi:hypothetical protein
VVVATAAGPVQLAGANEKWHIHGGNDQLITGLLARLPAGALHLGERLVKRSNNRAQRADLDLLPCAAERP